MIMLLLVTTLNGCKKSEYAELVKTELDKELILDSLMFGMKLGDTRQRFFDICWQLNKDKKVKQGPRNNFVQYELPTKNKDDVENRITMLFYGIFDDNKIMTGLDMRFYYKGWSLWNQSLHSEKLLPVIKDTLMSWYPGNEFIPITLKKSKKDVLVKVDGNRQILIEPLVDTREIDVRIDDLRYVKSLK
ncbi:MAG: hypothetical protein HKN90_00105 [Flavobacteriaceae bacterium]|nr:hypothetical protein [Flavobacteriaceae bacterium]